MRPQGDDLAAVAVTATEFEARTKAALLQAEGIDATVASNAGTWGVVISPAGIGASVLVRREDMERARRLIQDTIEDSVDLDWDQVDVGQREDDLPLRPPGRMPLTAMIGMAAVAAILIVDALLLVLALLARNGPTAPR